MDLHTGSPDKMLLIEIDTLKDRAMFLEKALRRAMKMLEVEITGEPIVDSYLSLCEEVRIALDEIGDWNDRWTCRI